MACTTYNCWVNDGRPWKNCQPINDFVAMLYRHGYTGPKSGIGDQSHLTANPPEDHCPYSHTPWPGAQPYPYVLAIDIMADEGLDIIDLGGRLFNDKNSNKPGTEPIKYINWTDSDNNCWHDSWQPNHTRYKSTDRGHIHMSFRTDYTTSNRMAIYDPYGGDPMTAQEVWAYQLENADGKAPAGVYLANGQQYSYYGGQAAYRAEWLARGLAAMADPILIPASNRLGVAAESVPNKLAQAILAGGGGSVPEHTHPVASSTTGPAEPV